MTNQEKARMMAFEAYPDRTLSDSRIDFDLNENDRIIFTKGAMKMAEWKDQQFKEYLERLQERFVEYDKHSNWLAIQEIINELFGGE